MAGDLEKGRDRGRKEGAGRPSQLNLQGCYATLHIRFPTVLLDILILLEAQGVFVAPVVALNRCQSIPDEIGVNISALEVPSERPWNLTPLSCFRSEYVCVGIEV
eukprot:1937467-Pyramimonas_sp.AAC.1